MKKLASQDWKDMLQVRKTIIIYFTLRTESFSQCAIPVFEGLLEDDSTNKRLMELLFLLARWQALAKLRLHTERTLDILRDVTRSLGIALRAFQKHMSTTFETRELPREAASRVRKKIKASQKQGKRQGGQATGSTAFYSTGTRNKGKGVIHEAATPGDAGKEHLIAFVILFMIVLDIAPESSAVHSESLYTRKPKVLNLNTYKLHSLGDYPETIKQYGTTDSYSTELVSNKFPITKKRN